MLAMASLLSAQSSFEKGLIKYATSQHSIKSDKILKAYLSLESELESDSWRGGKRKGGQNSNKPPDNIDVALKDGLDQILEIDTEKQLSRTHVIALVRDFVIDRCKAYDFEFPEEKAYSHKWFNERIANTCALPEYLSKNHGKTKTGRKQALDKIKENLNLDIP